MAEFFVSFKYVFKMYLLEYRKMIRHITEITFLTSFGVIRYRPTVCYVSKILFCVPTFLFFDVHISCFYCV